jgi:hypothetical protein
MRGSTPEGRVKTQVKRILKGYANLWSHWPVQNGMGSPTLDCVGIYYGFGFAIETKAPGEKPTPRQELTIADIRAAGGPVFVIDGEAGYKQLEEWLCSISALFSAE